jgi:integrase/recombinase XerD
MRAGFLNIIRSARALAGIRKNISPHPAALLCHNLQENGADCQRADHLGHADLSSTQIYTHVTRERLKRLTSKFIPRMKIQRLPMIFCSRS